MEVSAESSAVHIQLPAGLKAALAQPSAMHVVLGFEEEQSKKGARFRATYHLLNAEHAHASVPRSGQLTCSHVWNLPEDPTDRSGWLSKGPRMAKVPRAAVNQLDGPTLRSPPATRWHNRYFVLRGALLFYMHSPEAESLAGVIPMEGCSVQLADPQAAKENLRQVRAHGGASSEPEKRPTSNGKRPEGFEITITNPSRRSFRLVARTADECFGWLQSLRSATTRGPTVVPHGSLFGEEPSAADRLSTMGSTAASFDGEPRSPERSRPLRHSKPAPKTVAETSRTEPSAPDALRPRAAPSGRLRPQLVARQMSHNAANDRTVLIGEMSNDDILPSAPHLGPTIEEGEEEEEESRELGPAPAAEPDAQRLSFDWVAQAVRTGRLFSRVVEWEAQANADDGAPRRSGCVHSLLRWALNASTIDGSGNFTRDGGSATTVHFTVVLTMAADGAPARRAASPVWILRSRFSGFVALERDLRRAGVRGLPALPPKTALPCTWSIYGFEFLDARKEQVEIWLAKVVALVRGDRRGTGALLRFLLGTPPALCH